MARLPLYRQIAGHESLLDTHYSKRHTTGMTSASGNHRSYVPAFKVNEQTRHENGRSKARITAQLITDLSPRTAHKYHRSIIAYIQRDVNI